MIGRIENFGGIRGFAKCMHPTEDASRTPVLHSVTLRRMFLLTREALDRFKQMDEVGIPSLQAVIVTAIFSGMVFAIQTCTGFKRRGADHFFLSTREKLLLTSGTLARIRSIPMIRRHQLFFLRT